MIGTLRGSIASINSQYVLVEVAGVGYVVFAPTSAISSLAIGESALFYTYLAVREDALTLYGFTNQTDKEMFELLIGVSGIGPRLGLAILSAYSANEIVGAIRADNPALFSSVSGIGKKNAQRIILELKNKLPGYDILPESPLLGGSNDLQTALKTLGYSTDEIGRVIKEVDVTEPIEAQIKSALSYLAKSNI